MRTQKLDRWVMALVAVVVFGGATLAGQIEVSTYDGGPLDGPVLECDGDDGDTNQGGQIDDCAATQADVGWGDPGNLGCINTPSLPDGGGNQNFNLNEAINCDDNHVDHGLTVETLYDSQGNVLGVEIRHADGRDVESLCLRETSADIESVQVGLDTGKMAKIAKIPDGTRFQGGFIDVELNGQLFVFPTRMILADGKGLNGKIKDTLAKAGYQVAETANYLLILTDPGRAQIRSARFASSDPGFVFSAVSIEPPNYFDFPYCFPPASDPPEEQSGFKAATDGAAEISRF
jgi:hypothetical protein